MGRRWSLRARFVLVAVACLLPLLGVVLFVLVQSLGYGREQLFATQNAAADIVAQYLTETLEENRQVLTELANTDRVRKFDPEQANEVLAEFKRARPSLYGLFLVNADGNVVAKAGLDPDLVRMAPSFTTALDGALKLGDLGVSNKLEAPDADVIAITMPVRDKDQTEGQPSGAIGALISVKRLEDAILPFARGDTVIAIISEGDVIAAHGAGVDESDLTGQLAQPVKYAVAGAAGQQVYRDNAGVERLAAFAPVKGADWAVLVTQPSPMTYEPNRTLLLRGLAALGLAVLATLILAVILGEWIARPLRLLTAQASAIARGDFSNRVAPIGGGEVAALSVAFREMADQLENQVHDLEAAREAGARQAERLRELNRRTVRLQEDERRRIASEIHDAVAPLITGALYQARALRLAGGTGAAAAIDGEPPTAGLDAVGDLLAQAMEELHGVIFDLRPPDLDDLGVVAAIERYVGQVQRAGLNCRLEIVGDPPPLTPEVRLAIYRIVQEALHNALRHASADEAVVRLETMAGMLRVTIRDNGAGFNPELATRPTALGLLSMRERAAAIGATFTVATRPGDGTTVAIERRIEPERHDDEVVIVTHTDVAPLPAETGEAAPA